jgi:branched-chain amino acid transport system ATP-binding protein
VNGSSDDLEAGRDGAALLDVRDIEAGYGDLRALWGVSVTAWPGTVSLILGRNGAGKTTVLRTIAGLTSVQGGAVRFDGKLVNQVAAHRRARLGIAFVQEGKRIFVERTVEENILLGTYLKRWSRRERTEACERMYAKFPILADRRNRRAGTLSGGQQQMLAIAGALASAPRLLLLDEPSAGLAPAIVDDVMATIRSLCDEGLAVVLVEQNAERALPVADHVTVLDLGRVVVDVPAKEADISSLVLAAYFKVEAPVAAPPPSGGNGEEGSSAT